MEGESAHVWMDNPYISHHDYTAYLLARELPVELDARGEIVQALVQYVSGRLARLGCPQRRHLCRTIRLRIWVPGVGRLAQDSRDMLVPDANRRDNKSPRPRNIHDILRGFERIDPAINSMLNRIWDESHVDYIYGRAMYGFDWVIHALENIYCGY